MSLADKSKMDILQQYRTLEIQNDLQRQRIEQLEIELDLMESDEAFYNETVVEELTLP